MPRSSRCRRPGRAVPEAGRGRQGIGGASAADGAGRHHAAPGRNGTAARYRNRCNRRRSARPCATSDKPVRRCRGAEIGAHPYRRSRGRGVPSGRRRYRACDGRLRGRAGRHHRRLLARGANQLGAALWGIHLHSEAGARLARTIGPIGYLARELLPEIPRVLKSHTSDQRSTNQFGTAFEIPSGERQASEA